MRLSLEDRMTDAPVPLSIHALAELGRIDFRENDLEAVLGRVAALAKQIIPGTSDASVTLIQDGVATTAVYTGKTALALDERQYEEHRGPCLDAAAGSTIFGIPDMAADDRWEKFAAAAVAEGVHSSLSVGIPVQEALVGALNLYSTEPNTFDDTAIELAKTFASYAAVALANAHLFASTAALASQMQQAMESRSTIDQAIGILMAQRRCDAKQAFDLLVRSSQAANRKLRDVAKSIVDTTSARAH
jgi:GAF domain-containing protein